MKGHFFVARAACAVLGLWAFIVGIDLENLPRAFAESESDSSLVAAEQVAVLEAEAGDRGMDKDKKCKDPIPCAVNNPPLATDKDVNGVLCPAGKGNACRVPGAGCGPGARVDGKCQTSIISGQCQCQCVY